MPLRASGRRPQPQRGGGPASAHHVSSVSWSQRQYIPRRWWYQQWRLAWPCAALPRGGSPAGEHQTVRLFVLTDGAGSNAWSCSTAGQPGHESALYAPPAEHQVFDLCPWGVRRTLDNSCYNGGQQTQNDAPRTRKLEGRRSPEREPRPGFALVCYRGDSSTIGPEYNLPLSIGAESFPVLRSNWAVAPAHRVAASGASGQRATSRRLGFFRQQACERPPFTPVGGADGSMSGIAASIARPPA